MRGGYAPLRFDATKIFAQPASCKFTASDQEGKAKRQK
jgi:hypothetical protein